MRSPHKREIDVASFFPLFSRMESKEMSEVTGQALFKTRPITRRNQVLRSIKSVLYPNRFAKNYLPFVYGYFRTPYFMRGAYFKTLVNKSHQPDNSSVIRDVFDGKDLTYDLFTTNVSIWQHYFKDRSDSISAVLEIGSFEGASALFLAWLFPNATIDCVDLFVAGSEQRFMANTAPLGTRLSMYKGPSFDHLISFNAKGRRFDFIYIDGGHSYQDVMQDSLLSWPLLNDGGILLWDDYFWKNRSFGKLQPKPAIDKFLEMHKGQFRFVFVGNQVCVEKLSGSGIDPHETDATEARSFMD
jgi:Methyltransferase domain